jgi:hypothetical protein
MARAGVREQLPRRGAELLPAAAPLSRVISWRSAAPVQLDYLLYMVTKRFSGSLHFIRSRGVPATFRHISTVILV